MNTKKEYTLSLSDDAKFALIAGQIRDQVLSKEFNLEGYDFSSDEYDATAKAIYLLADDRCIGATRIVTRADAGRLPLESYAEIESIFPEQNPSEYNVYCEFSRLAVLPEFQSTGGGRMLIDSSIDYALSRGLNKVVYCSTENKTRSFNVLSKRKDFAFTTSEKTFVFADCEHLVLQASVADLHRHYDGRSRLREVV